MSNRFFGVDNLATAGLTGGEKAFSCANNSKRSLPVLGASFREIRNGKALTPRMKRREWGIEILAAEKDLL